LRRLAIFDERFATAESGLVVPVSPYLLRDLHVPRIASNFEREGPRTPMITKYRWEIKPY